MKRFNILFAIFFVLLLLISSSPVRAQTTPSTDDHTAREEAEGKEIWKKLQNKEVTCETLSDEDFGALGEYYMGQMTGNSHEAMNTMMERMMGKAGEEQMHVAMGKRLSGCDTSAALPQNGVGFMPMMWMMRGGQQSPFNQTGSPMMFDSWVGLNFWLFSLSLVVWLIVGVFAAIWLFKQISKK